MPVDQAFNLASAILKSNEYLKDDPPLRRGLSLLASFLVVFVILHEYMEPSTKLIESIKQAAPELVHPYLAVATNFLTSLVIIAIFFLFAGQRAKPKKVDDHYSPIREELVKLRHWTLEMREFFADGQNKDGRLELNIDERKSKLSLKVILTDAFTVEKSASDISLRVLGNSDISLLFYVDGLAGGARAVADEDTNSEFEYLFNVNGGQIEGQSGLKMTGEWYRLSDARKDLKSRGPCVITALV